MFGLNIADFVGVAILLLMGFWGMKKGLVRTVFGLISILLSLVIALSLYPVVTDFLEDSPLGTAVHTQVENMFDANAEAKAPEATEETPSSLPDVLKNSIQAATDRAVNSVKVTAADAVADLALKILSILIVFILTRIILWVLQRVLNIIAKLPVIHTANKLLGGVAGVLSGILVVYLILALLTFTTTLKSFETPTRYVLESTYISEMYHNNIVLNWIN